MGDFEQVLKTSSELGQKAFSRPEPLSMEWFMLRAVAKVVGTLMRCSFINLVAQPAGYRGIHRKKGHSSASRHFGQHNQGPALGVFDEGAKMPGQL